MVGVDMVMDVGEVGEGKVLSPYGTRGLAAMNKQIILKQQTEIGITFQPEYIPFGSTNLLISCDFVNKSLIGVQS
jgi:hypothetical protein